MLVFCIDKFLHFEYNNYTKTLILKKQYEPFNLNDSYKEE